MNAHIMPFVSAEPAPSKITGRTTVITVRAPCERVFNYLADVENLPRWAGDFCGELFLGGGRWMAFTSLGELFLELETELRAGKIVLRAGWEATQLWPVVLWVGPCPEGGTRIKLVIAPAAGAAAGRLHRALEAELRARCERWEPDFFGGTAAPLE
jgi:hypothetical protein